MLAFYREAVQYYRWKRGVTMWKDVGESSLEEAVKNNPELS